MRPAISRTVPRWWPDPECGWGQCPPAAWAGSGARGEMCVPHTAPHDLLSSLREACSVPRGEGPRPLAGQETWQTRGAHGRSEIL